MIAVTPFGELADSAVEAARAEIAARVAADHPQLETGRGVFAGILVRYHALLEAQRLDQIEKYRKARSLLALSADPSADAELVDDVLSNYLVSRRPGTVASGEVTVVVSDDVTVTVAAGSVWSAGGRDYTADTVYTAKLEASQLNGPGDRRLVRVGTSSWAFTIRVTAAAEGAEYALKKDDAVVPAVFPANYESSYASSDFSGGRSAETNDELLARLQRGVAAKAPSNRVNMNAALLEDDRFAGVVRTSVVGYGDGEMRRDKRGVFPVSFGGRVDWYVRSSARAEKKAVSFRATLVSKVGGVGTWQATLGRDDAAGVYEVRDVRAAGSGPAAGGAEVLSDSRGLDLTGVSPPPDVVAGVEQVYSAYQTITFTFRDPDVDAAALAVGHRADYEASAVRVPLVADIQAAFADRAAASCTADVLVKAPVPCFVRVGLVLYRRATDAQPDLDAVRNAAADAVNAADFSGRLYASAVLDAAYAVVPAGARLGSADLLGRIRRPAGDDLYDRSSEVLEVPADEAGMVTRRTVQFFCDPADVSVAVTTAPPPSA